MRRQGGTKGPAKVLIRLTFLNFFGGGGAIKPNIHKEKQDPGFAVYMSHAMTGDHVKRCLLKDCNAQ